MFVGSSSRVSSTRATVTSSHHSSSRISWSRSSNCSTMSFEVVLPSTSLPRFDVFDRETSPSPAPSEQRNKKATYANSNNLKNNVELRCNNVIELNSVC